METIKRRACRAIILTPEKRVLLIRVESPDGSWKGWITPGGGINEDEDEKTALARELFEEIGLEKISIGQKIWSRTHTFTWRNKTIEQQEIFFLIRTSSFEPITSNNPDFGESEDCKEFRWWSLEEIQNSVEEFAPRKLTSLLAELLEHGLPSSVIDVGV